MHSGEKPFKCDHCDKAIVLNSNLTSHQIAHIEEKPCKYDECDQNLLKKFILFVIKEHTMVQSYINVTSIIKRKHNHSLVFQLLIEECCSGIVIKSVSLFSIFCDVLTFYEEIFT